MSDYWTCDTCSYAVSGQQGPSLDKRLDTHERNNTGHRMQEEPDA